MKTYTATFTGRRIGNIGITYYIVDHVNGVDEENARINLYEKYEHISNLKLREHGKDE